MKESGASKKVEGSSRLSRREFVEAAAAAAAFTFVPRRVLGEAGQPSANNKLNIAGIGVGGQGGSDINQCSQDGANIVALCDVDDERAKDTFKKFPNARQYRDFRQMLDKEAQEYRCRGHCHARPLPCPGGDSGDADGQACVRRKAHGAHDL